jgi:hypothetical protein
MTLVIALANADQIIQVSDRRLSANGRLFDDSSNKAGHAICDDASFLYSFTGLARAGSHVTSRWLLDALYNSAQKKHGYFDIANALTEEATRYFHSSNTLRALPAASRRLTIMYTGYTSNDLIVSSLISNFQDFTNFIDHPKANREFTIYTEESIRPAAENPTMMQVIGQFGSFTQADEAELRQMLEQRAPAEGIRQKAIAIVQDIADRPSSHNTVGKRINTARLPHCDPMLPVVGYVSDIVENTTYFPDQINLRSGAPKLISYDAQLTADSPVVFPKVHRNALCPCGSGLQFRYCHRK